MTVKNRKPSAEEIKRSHVINSHVGSRIRLRRHNLGLSAVDVAASLGVRYQQLQHYERGNSQISSASLLTISKLFNVPISFFFDEMPSLTSFPEIPKQVSAKDPADMVNIFSVKDIKFVEMEVRDLANAFYGIENKSTRKGIVEFLKILARNKW